MMEDIEMFYARGELSPGFRPFSALHFYWYRDSKLCGGKQWFLNVVSHLGRRLYARYEF